MTRHTSLRPTEIDALAIRALQGDVAARASIRTAAEEAGIRLQSLRTLYAAFADGTVSGCTVPAMNVRGMSYEFIRAIIRAAQHSGVGPFIIELARSEMRYGEQTPDDLVVFALAAALREGYQGPLAIQGDHFQVDPGKPRDEEMAALTTLIDQSLAAGFTHIDIDASKTVDLSKSNRREQQAHNADITAHFTKYIRTAYGDRVVIGGEIGEIGGRVSTADDLRAYMSLYRESVGELPGIAKVAVQTGTSHGGTPNPDGSIKAVAVDLATARELSRIARNEFHLAGAVQHGASTLSDEQIAAFPDAGIAEVHLSTGFQNVVFDHPALPQSLRDEMTAYVHDHFSSERTDGMTDAQFVYKNRKRLWGPFKQQLAHLPEDARVAIGDALEQRTRDLFTACRVTGTRVRLAPYLT